MYDSTRHADASNSDIEVTSTSLPMDDNTGDDGMRPAAIGVTETNEDNHNLHIFWQRFEKAQRIAVVLAHLLALLSTLRVIQWIHVLGGLSWQQGQAKLVFNWHPLLMILAFNFMTVATLSFQYPQLVQVRRHISKLVHASAWTVGVLSMTIGLMAVFRSHNDPVSGFIANLYSFHSWIGILVFAMYLLQFALGLVVFAAPAQYQPICVTPSLKAQVLAIHHYFGPVIYGSVALTILLGIQEKEGFIGCGYSVEEADLRPWRHSIPSACQISHSMGFLVFFTTICTMLALYRPKSGGNAGYSRIHNP